ncbi:MAG: hypothetical protein QXJ62_02465 [Nitrososphaeria archaeon]
MTIVNEICNILASLIVIGTFIWGYVTGVFEGISISTKEILSVRETYVKGFDLLISGKIDEAEKSFRSVYSQYPTYKSAKEILNLFKEGRRKYKKNEEIKMYILEKIIEKELVIPSQQQYEKIWRIVYKKKYRFLGNSI